MQHETTTLQIDTTRPQSCRKPFKTSFTSNSRPPTLSRDNSLIHNKESHNGHEIVNLYDRRALKESKDMMQKIDQMKNRLTYIDREGEKNMAQMKIKQQKLSYIKETKEKASEWFGQLNEARIKQEKEQEELKRKVSTTATQIVENVYKSKQKLLQTRAMNYKQMKADKEMVKQIIIELELKDLEEKKLKAKRLASSKKNSFLCTSNTPMMPQSTHKSGPIQWFKSVKKPKNDKENELTLESMQREFEHLATIEQKKLEKLQHIIKEKKEVENSYNEILLMRNSEVENLYK